MTHRSLQTDDRAMTLTGRRCAATLRASPAGIVLTLQDAQSGRVPIRDCLWQLYPGRPLDLGSVNIQQGHAARDALAMAGEAPRPDRVGMSRFEEDDTRGVKIALAYGDITVALYVWADEAEPALRVRAQVTNRGPRAALIHSLVNRLDGLRLGQDWNDEWIFPATYSSNVLTHGRVDSLRPAGIACGFMPIGLYLPYVMLYDPRGAEGVLFDAWLDTRYALAVNPDRAAEQVTLAALTRIERALLPGQTHAWGEFSLRAFTGHYHPAMQHYRQTLADARGLRVPADVPASTPDLIFANLSFNFDDCWGSFTDRSVEQYLREVRDLGANCLYVNGQWRSGLYHTRADEPEWRNSCIILPENGRYTPEPVYGGIEGHRAFLDLAHSLGLKAIGWITTCGVGFESDEVREHPEWFLHDEAGEIRARARSRRVKHIADGNFLSPGWRRWFVDNVKHLHALGYDGVFLDGITPKEPDAWAYPWPGQGQVGIIDQVRELRHEIKSIAPDFLFVPEDCGCYWNALGEVCLDRYHLRLPAIAPRHDDPEHIRRTPLNDGSYPRISPADVLDFLRIGQYSLLPDARVLAYDLKHHGRQSLPWLYYGALADLIPVVFYRDRATYAEPHIYALTEEELRDAALEEAFYQEMRTALALRQARDELRRAPVLFDALDTQPPGVVGFARPYAGRLSLVFINFWPDERMAQTRITRPDALGLSGGQHQLRDLLHPEISRLAGEVRTPAQLAQPWSFPIAGYSARVLALDPV